MMKIINIIKKRCQNRKVFPLKIVMIYQDLTAKKMIIHKIWQINLSLRHLIKVDWKQMNFFKKIVWILSQLHNNKVEWKQVIANCKYHNQYQAFTHLTMLILNQCLWNKREKIIMIYIKMDNFRKNKKYMKN